MNRLQIEEIFPTPIVIEQLPKKFSSLTPYFNSQELISNNNSEREFGRFSKNTYIFNEPECLELSKYILNRAYLYGYHCLGMASESSKYQFTQSWVSVKYPNEKHEYHVHSNSIISGVIFLQGTKNTPNLQFINQPDNIRKSSINFKERDADDMMENNSGYQCHHHNLGKSINFIPGLMVLFPSYLLHTVPVNKTSLPRKSLSFNIVTNPIGDTNSLNELKIF